jgi:hypothetical protein
MRVLVVGYNGEDGDDAGLGQDFSDLMPNRPVHGRAEVVEADEKPGALQHLTPKKS